MQDQLRDQLALRYYGKRYKDLCQRRKRIIYEQIKLGHK